MTLTLNNLESTIKIIESPTTGPTAIVFIAGSAGELDWVLPILAFLLKKGFNIKIIFLTGHAVRSVHENKTLLDFISTENSQVETVIIGGYLFEKAERFGYLLYRIFLKLKLDNISIMNRAYGFCDTLFERLFMCHLPSDLVKFKEKKYLFISEFPSLRRPRNNWIRKKFVNSVFFYCPHSPHIYAEDLDQQYYEEDDIDFDKDAFLLLGHPGDFTIVRDGKEFDAPDLQKVFIGHPKYSASWLKSLITASKAYRSNIGSRDKINILVVSRGFGTYLDETSYKQLIDSTIAATNKVISKYRLLVKKHPRELSPYWDEIIEKYPSVEIVNEHVLQLATEVDFVITFWGSGAMDCFSVGVPVIEYWDPNRHNKDQVHEENSYTTIYRKIGIVVPANTDKELEKAISRLLETKFKVSMNNLHPFFIDLIDRSNKWDEVIEKILVSTNLIPTKNS